MGKYKSKLSKQEVEKYFYQLCVAVAELKNPYEASELLKDLLSFPEAEMIAKRLKIAELVLDGLTYEQIKKQLKVGASTIARVQEWMKVSGDGYQKAAKRIKGKDKDVEKANVPKQYNPENWGSIKKRFPMYYWPQIVLENIVQEMNARQKEKVRRVISQMGKMKQKSDLFRQLNRLMKSSKNI